MSNQHRGPMAKEKFQMKMAGDFGVFYTDKNSPVFYLNTSFDIDDIGISFFILRVSLF